MKKPLMYFIRHFDLRRLIELISLNKCSDPRKNLEVLNNNVTKQALF